MFENAKKNVCTVWPEAYYSNAFGVIMTGQEPTPAGEETLGFGDNESDAWIDAEERIHKAHNA